MIGDRDLRTSNERRDDVTSDERCENSDDGLDLEPRSIERLIEAALRDMPIILERTTLVYKSKTEESQKMLRLGRRSYCGGIPPGSLLLHTR